MKKLIIIVLSVIYTTLIYAQQYGSLTDSRDGKIYKTVKIGNQEWMAENLNVVTFRNGDSIQEAKNDEEWHVGGLNGTPVWRKKILDSDTVILYNWYTINDKRGLAPKGYHIPSNDEWAKLINFLGGKKLAAKKLKASQGWPDLNSLLIDNNGTNSSGFNALSGRSIYSEHDIFWLDGERTLYWSSTEDTLDNSKAWSWGFMVLWEWDNSVLSELWDKRYEFSVRCVKLPNSEQRVKNEQNKKSNENNNLTEKTKSQIKSLEKQVSSSSNQKINPNLKNEDCSVIVGEYEKFVSEFSKYCSGVKTGKRIPSPREYLNWDKNIRLMSDIVLNCLPGIYNKRIMTSMLRLQSSAKIIFSSSPQAEELERDNNSNNKCTFCKPSDSKGWYIQDYDEYKKEYTNGRYVKNIGHKPCSLCYGTGNCKAYNGCGNYSNKESNSCTSCKGDRWQECYMCKGTGESK